MHNKMIDQCTYSLQTSIKLRSKYDHLFGPQEKHKNEEQIIMLKENLITSSKPPLRSIFLHLYLSCNIKIKLHNKITNFNSNL
jgi:hypothetical protein